MNPDKLDDVILFADDDDDDLVSSQTEPDKAWHILVVDDDAEIHTVTQLALNGLTTLGKPLYFGHAYSGKESIEYIQDHEDVAVILMDVVMEHENAGLDAVKSIRESLGQKKVRIILRTGQPGYAPEETVVQQYDINDYKTKTELTRSKLVTTLISAIRGYEQIRQIEESKVQLESIIESCVHIQQQDPEKFCYEVFNALNNLLGVEAQGLICLRPLQDENRKRPFILSATANYQECSNLLIENIDSGRIIHQVSQCLSQQAHQINDADATLFVRNKKFFAAIYLDSGLNKETCSEQLLNVLLSNIAVSLENVQLFQELKNTAYKDSLTGLSNRTDFIRMLDRYVDDTSLGDTAVLIDLTHFADINDGLGQEIGNKLLIACAERLQEKYAKNSKLARVSADVFGIIGHKMIVNPDHILELFRYPLKVDDQRIPVHFSMGFCERDPSDKTGLRVLKHADIALNHAKKDTQQCFAYFSDVMEQKTAWRLGMAHQLREDFEADKLQVWFQPQLDLASHKIMGFEALLRWPKIEGGMIEPEVFVPLAEHSGLMVDIGNWVVEESCRQLKKLEDKGFKNIRISVNVSMAQFKNPNFVPTIIDTIHSFDVRAESIELEITESVLMNNPATVIEALTLLKAEGIQVSLDDFGTGFSSLNYLHQLPLDRMKIDRAFVRDILSKNGEVIVQTVLELGKKLGLHTIAEGVEEMVQERRLVDMGCEEVQGYLYARPLAPEQVQDFVMEHQKSLS
ncbi:bifunctional diguanylate cyclase/phosphodiesterase [Catenovulum sediminis]|uniref:bifunctional diguanylate cyclase/phosphodiesterase n=1 Tax=Catenovulum sediminis TaxID=1740262 RepID=UPI001180526C|nr:EAL domain-containing protein [Catenovulum sediminis]